MNRIFSDVDEKLVKTVVAYGNKTDKFIYSDEAFTKKVSKEELKNAFVKGMLIIKYERAFYMPLIVKEELTGEVTVCIYDATAVIPAVVKFKSNNE